MSQPRTTQFPTTLQPDAPLVQDAFYRLDKSDRAYIDGQILGIQSVIARGSNGNALSLQGTPIASTSPGTGQVLQFNGTQWAPANLASTSLAGDITGTLGATVVSKIQGVTVDPATMGAPSNGNVIQYTSGGSKWVAAALSVGPSGITPGSAGQYLVTNAGATAAAWTTLSGDVTSSAVTVGKHTVVGLQGNTVSVAAPSAGNTLGWTGSAWAPSALNLAGGANYVTGALPVGSIAFGSAGQFLVTNAEATAAAWATISGDIAASTSTVGQLNVQSITPTGGTSTIVPFNAGGFKAGSTWALQDSGNVTRFSVSTAHGVTTMGGGGTDFCVVAGPYSGAPGTFSALYFVATPSSPTGSNYSFLGDGTNTRLNALGYVRIESNSSIPLMVIQNSAPQQTWYDGSGNAAIALTLSSTGTCTIQAATTVATGIVFGTNKASATTVLQGDAATTILTLSTIATFAAAVALQGTHVASTGDLRAQSGTTILASRNNANSADISQIATDSSDNVTLGDGTNAATLALASSGDLSQKIGSTTLHILHNNSGVYRRTLHGYHVNSLTTKSSNYTINSAGPGDRDIWMTASCTITLPAPEAGMDFRIIVDYDPTASGGTIARHGAENINGAASNLTLTGSDKFSVLAVASNGVDWVIKGGLSV